MKIKIIELSSKEGLTQGILKAVILNKDPKIGSVYELTEYDEHTDQQRKLFNPLCRLYYNSGAYSYPSDNWLDLREHVKKNLGAGFQRYEYANKDYQIVRVKRLEEIPSYVLKDFTGGNKRRIKGVLKSMADYTRNEFINVVDSLIREMLSNMVLSGKEGSKFNDILNEIGFIE